MKKAHSLALILCFGLVFSIGAFSLSFAFSNQASIQTTTCSPENRIFRASHFLETNPGQDVVDYFRQIFTYDWSLGENYDYIIDGIGDTQSRTIAGSGYGPFAAQRIEDFMKISPVLSPNNSEAKIIDLINLANTSLAIQQMYFYNDLEDIRDAIIAASQRGVNVTIILEADNSNSDELVSYLQGYDISIKQSQNLVPIYFDTQHNKGIIVDEAIVLISSINWSPTSLYYNREAGLIIENEQVAQYYQTLYNHDWSVCTPYEISEASVHSENKFFERSTPCHTIQPVADKNLRLVTPISFSVNQTFSGTFNVDVMASPDNCYEVVESIINDAEESIDISVYTLSSPYIMDALHRKLSEGVKIRLLLEKYQVSSYERNYNRHALYNFTHLGVSASDDPSTTLFGQGLWASSEFTFQHGKYAIIDNQTLILSSGNWARSSMPKPQLDGDVDGNRDWWIAIYGDNPGELPDWDVDDDTTNDDDTSPEEDIHSLLSDLWGENPLLFFFVIGLLATLLILKIRQ